MNKDLKKFIKDSWKWGKDYIEIWIKTKKQVKQKIYDYIKDHKENREKDNIYWKIDLWKVILFINQL